MKVIRGIQAVQGSDSSADTSAGTVLTIGNFDGVHLGHREIFRLTLEKARARNGVAAAYTFRPHPQVALRPGAHIQLLSTYDEKIELMQAMGLDLVIEEPFSRQFSSISPQQFFSDMVLKTLNAQAIVVGYDFAFGKERQGHLEALEKLCLEAGIELTVVPPQSVGNEVVSSSKIRHHLLAGDTDIARRQLGRSFSYRGIVSRGDGRGRQLGFPTTNLAPEEGKLVLPHGVYATWAACEAGFPGQRIPSVTNVGVRPTFSQGQSVRIETHLFDVDKDLYGSLLEVHFEKRLRDERRFDGIEALKAQIALDSTMARTVLASTSCS